MSTGVTQPRFDETLAEQWRRILTRSPALLDELPAAGAPRVLFGSMFSASFSTPRRRRSAGHGASARRAHHSPRPPPKRGFTATTQSE